MKTLIVTGKGTVHPGDFICLSYSAPGGGRSDARCRVPSVQDAYRLASEKAVQQMQENNLPEMPPVVPEVPTITTVLQKLADAINSEAGEWCPGSGDFKATRRDDTLYVQCSDLLSNVTFHIEIEGAGKETAQFELRTLGG